MTTPHPQGAGNGGQAKPGDGKRMGWRAFRRLSTQWPPDTWAWLQTGHLRAARWLAAVVIVAGSWWWGGDAHSASQVIYPLVLAGLMFAPDVTTLTIFGNKVDLNASRPAVQRELGDAALRAAKASGDLHAGQKVTLDDLLAEVHG